MAIEADGVSVRASVSVTSASIRACSAGVIGWATAEVAANSAASASPSYMAGPDPPSNKAWADNCQRGVMGPNASVTLKRVTDGTSKSIMLGEIRAGMTENDARGTWAM